MIKNPLGRKINVLVVPSDRTGVSYFRSTKPHIYLEQKYPEDFHVDIEYEPKLDDDKWLKQYDIIHYHRTLGAYEKVSELLERLDKLGILTFMDIDDHWAPGTHHPAHRQIKASGVDKLISNNVKSARNILTTTPMFAEEMKQMNENIFVIPNSIDPNEKQYISKPTEHPRLRIGWLGGSSHLEDLKLLKGVVRKLKGDKLLDKVQFVLCGYDLRGSMIDTDRVTGKQTQRNIRPMESVWYEYEKIFTDNYSTVSPEYKDYLLKFTKDEYPDVENEPYKRVWTKPIKTYATNYNQFDVSLAPLCVNTFNKVKSQLKVIESGFHKKAIVAQDFGPYTIDLKTAKLYGGDFDETGNALTVDTSKNHKQWYQHIKFLIENPDKVELLAENLYNTVTERYSIGVTTEARRELYLQRLSDLLVEGETIDLTSAPDEDILATYKAMDMDDEIEVIND